jgi:tetrahydromethanopterin S-methyltransferase subunit G
MGELCFRDLESMVFGTIIIKPSHKKVDTIPNIMVDDETYIPCKYDWSDLDEKIDYVLSNFDELNERINTNIRNLFFNNCTDEKLCLYYYNLFSNYTDIEHY